MKNTKHFDCFSLVAVKHPPNINIKRNKNPPNYVVQKPMGQGSGFCCMYLKLNYCLSNISITCVGNSKLCYATDMQIENIIMLQSCSKMEHNFKVNNIFNDK